MQKILISIIILASLLAGLSAYLLFRNNPTESVIETPVVQKDEIKEVLRVFAVANADSDVDGVDMNTNKGAVNYTNETFPKNLTNGKRVNECDIVHDYALTDYVSENVVGYGGHGDALNFAITLKRL